MHIPCTPAAPCGPGNPGIPKVEGNVFGIKMYFKSDKTNKLYWKQLQKPVNRVFNVNKNCLL